MITFSDGKSIDERRGRAYAAVPSTVLSAVELGVEASCDVGGVGSNTETAIWIHPAIRATRPTVKGARRVGAALLWSRRLGSRRTVALHTRCVRHKLT